MDSKPVNFLATGCATTLSAVNRREKDGSITRVDCPKLVEDYHKGMGGVDVHNQRRLLRYSLQKAVCYRKYYKALFLGLVDMAIINGYVVHRTVCDHRGERYMILADYMNQLHKGPLALTKSDVTRNINAEDLIPTPTRRPDHELTQSDDMYHGGDRQKRRQHLCKVCSALSAPKTKSFETTWYCRTCSTCVGGQVSLCDRVRRKDSGNMLSCSQIWHEEWVNGTAIPPALRKKIRFRKQAGSNRGNISDAEGKEERE